MKSTQSLFIRNNLNILFQYMRNLISIIHLLSPSFMLQANNHFPHDYIACITFMHLLLSKYTSLNTNPVCTICRGDLSRNLWEKSEQVLPLLLRAYAGNLGICIAGVTQNWGHSWYNTICSLVPLREAAWKSISLCSLAQIKHSRWSGSHNLRLPLKSEHF